MPSPRSVVVPSRTTTVAPLGVVVGLSPAAAGDRDTTPMDIRLLFADARPGAGEDSGEKAGAAGHH
jgi:hypothetical protein